jgi:hypothetical protein
MRFASGPDRPCALHADDTGPTLQARMAAYALMLEAAPGDHDDDDAKRS